MGGHYYTLAVLLQHGAAKSARDNNGDTPLHWAAKGGQADLVS
jgi:ankyrin repeat protein